MYFIRLIPAVLLAAGLAPGAPPADDTPRTTPPAAGSVTPSPATLPPVLRNPEKEDNLIVTLPGPPPAPNVAAPAADPPAVVDPHPGPESGGGSDPVNWRTGDNRPGPNLGPPPPRLDWRKRRS